MKMDGKFHGIVVKNKDQSVVPQDQWIVFLAKDDAVPATLNFYLRECERLGADESQLMAVRELIDRVRRWRFGRPDLCKVPDVHPGEINY